MLKGFAFGGVFVRLISYALKMNASINFARDTVLRNGQLPLLEQDHMVPFHLVIVVGRGQLQSQGETVRVASNLNMVNNLLLVLIVEGVVFCLCGLVFYLTSEKKIIEEDVAIVVADLTFFIIGFVHFIAALLLYVVFRVVPKMI